MSRSLSPSLFSEFQYGGVLLPLLHEVQNDDTLCLEFRGDAANVYYRGGSLFKVEKVGKGYGLSFDIKYNTKNDPMLKAKTNDIQKAVDLIPYYKRAMDYWFNKNEKLERETQQLILRENNFTKNSGASDYYILDIEYNDDNPSKSGQRKGRYDMVALKWLSKGSERKAPQCKPSLALVELKYGDGALKNDAGIAKHLDDFEALLKDESKVKMICKDMETVYEQKHVLGLLRGLDGKKQGSIKIAYENPEVIFAFANHDPDSKVLKAELMSINWNKYDFSIRFAVSSAMGYNLYADKLLDAQQFINTLKN